MSKPGADKKKTGGSITLERRGLVRGGGENAMAPSADKLCVLGGNNPGDMSEAEARRLYKGDKRAQEVFTAIRDAQRAGEPCPEFFWHTCRDGIIKAVQYVDLGIASDGVTYLFMVDGRHRKAAAIEVTKEREACGSPLGPLPLISLNVPLPADPMKAAEIVRSIKTKSNIHVPMAPSSLAARALEYNTGASHYAIGVTIGLRAEVAEQQVGRLLALALCIPEVQAAVDAEPDLLAIVGKWRSAKSGELTKSESEQRAWLAARSAPKVARPKANGHPRPLSPAKIAKIAKLEPELADCPALLEVLSLLSGKRLPKDIQDAGLRAAWLRAFGEAAS